MKYILAFLVFTQTLFAFNLKEKFLQAEAGSYVVTEQNQISSLLHLHTIKEDKLLFEEISIPSHQVHHTNWKEWAANGARGHTAWVLYEVDLKENKITECYSLSRKAWIQTDEMNAFFIPLLTLKLKYLSEKERIQRGPTAAPGEVGRGPWGPPQVLNGKKIKDPQFDVFTTIWPHDESDLSGKHIVLYFDHNQDNFPFPYWIQARDGGIKFKMRAIDSGTGMFSPITDIPRRTPTFDGGVRHEDGEVTIYLNVPTYYDSLKLYAIDLIENPRLTHLIPFEKRRYSESVQLTIPNEKLKEVFTPNHEYLWIVAADEMDEVTESPHLFKWTLEN